MYPRSQLGCRLRDTNARALDDAATQTGAVEETGGLTAGILNQIHTRGGDFDATFVLWSPMTQPFKSTLGFDNPGNDRATSFPEPARNAERGAQDGAGQRLPIGRRGVFRPARRRHSRCDEVGGLPRAWRHISSRVSPAILTRAGPERPIVVVTESLGSKVLFDAARAVYHDVGPDPGARTAMNRRFAPFR